MKTTRGRGVVPEPLTLDARGVAELVGWHHRNGQPRTDEVYRLARNMRNPFPLPVNDGDSPRRWRWSRHEIEAWCRTPHNGDGA